MANRFPYASPGSLVAAVEQLRKSFPAEVSADTLRKLGIAPKNESYVINTLRFLGIIDEEGNKVAEAATAFLKGDDDFQDGFAALVKAAYADLFELHADDAWTLSRDALVQFFRTTDHTSEVVGKRQAGTFTCLAGLAGHAELPATRVSPGGKPSTPKKKETPGAKKAGSRETKVTPQPGGKQTTMGIGNVGLTVRIEINLPADGDQTTYDRIFKSIRKNLIDGE